MSAITKEAVAQARKKIMSRHGVPSTTEVRTELGDTGSYSTIGKFLREIITEEEQQREAARTVVTAECEQVAKQSLGAIWNAVKEHMDQSYQSKVQELMTIAENLQRENQELAAQLDRYRKKSEDDDAQLKSMNLKLGEAEGARKSLTGENGSLRRLVENLTNNLFNQSSEMVSKLAPYANADTEPTRSETTAETTDASDGAEKDSSPEATDPTIESPFYPQPQPQPDGV